MFNRLNSLCTSFTVASVLALSGIATAQTTDAPQVRSSTETVSVQTTTLKDGTNTVEVRVVDGQVFVKVNGEQRPTRSLDGDWAKFEIRAKDGESTIATVLKDSKSRGVLVLSGSPTPEEIARHRRTFESPSFPARTLRPGVEVDLDIDIPEEYRTLLRGLARVDLGEGLAADRLRELELSFGDDQRPLRITGLSGAAQPKSMIGITMNIEATQDGERVIVEEVMEGLPAAQAGLQAGDRIIEIESIGSADEQAVRRLTREFEPGSKVVLRILRDGEEMEKVIELAPYRSNVFGTIGRGEGGIGQRFFTFEQDAQRLAEIRSITERLQAEITERRAEIERLAMRLQDSDEPERIAEQLRDAAQAMEESVRRLSEQRLRQNIDRGMADMLQWEGGGGVIVGRGAEGRGPLVFTIPQAPTPPAPPAAGEPSQPVSPPSPQAGRAEQRIDALEQRLDRLEESNRRIEEMLQALMRDLGPRG